MLSFPKSELKPCPEGEPWWRRLLYRIGALGEIGVVDDVVSIERKGKMPRLFPLDSHLHVRLSAWSLTEELAWVNFCFTRPKGSEVLRLNSVARELALSTTLPWSAVPQRVLMARPNRTLVEPALFLALWNRIVSLSATRELKLPILEEGRYETQARDYLPPEKRNKYGDVLDVEHHGAGKLKMLPPLSREKLKVYLKKLHPADVVCCPWCGVKLHVREVISHQDRVHSSLQSIPEVAEAPTPSGPKRRVSRSDVERVVSMREPPPLKPGTIKLGESPLDDIEEVLEDLHPDQQVFCPVCDATLKSRGMVRHLLRAHPDAI